MNADKLAKALDELPAAYDLLPLFMLPGSRPDAGSLQRHGASNTRSLIVFTALDLADTRTKADASPTRSDYELDKLAGARRQGVLPTLSSWVRLVDCEMWDSGEWEIPQAGVPAKGVPYQAPSMNPTVAGECAWLRSQIDWISQQQWLDEITHDVDGMLRDIREVTGEDDKLAGKLFCIRPGCGWEVTERYGGEAYVCKGCGNTWGRLELHRMAERQKLKPLVECANLAGVSDKTLRRYKAQGVLKVAGRQGKTELFDPDEVMQLTLSLRYRQMTSA